MILPLNGIDEGAWVLTLAPYADVARNTVIRKLARKSRQDGRNPNS